MIFDVTRITKRGRSRWLVVLIFLPVWLPFPIGVYCLVTLSNRHLVLARSCRLAMDLRWRLI
jgi:hypothetical protein